MNHLWQFSVWSEAVADVEKFENHPDLLLIAKHPRSLKGKHPHFHCIIWTDSIRPNTVNKRIREYLKPEYANKGGGLEGSETSQENEKELKFITYLLRHHNPLWSEKFPSAYYKLKVDRWSPEEIQDCIDSSTLKPTDIAEKVICKTTDLTEVIVNIQPKKAKKLALYTHCRLVAEAHKEGNPNSTQTLQQVAAIVVEVIREDYGRDQPRGDTLRGIVNGLWAYLNKGDPRVKTYNDRLIASIAQENF